MTAEALSPDERDEIVVAAPPEPVLLDAYRKRRDDAEEARLEQLVRERWTGPKGDR